MFFAYGRLCRLGMSAYLQPQPQVGEDSLITFSTASRVSPVRFWIRPTSSSCLPSAYWRSLSVSLAHFCFSFPLVMFQSPLISSLFIILCFVLSFVFVRRQRDGKSVLAARMLPLRESSAERPNG